ncbi:MAG: hypothetical protein ACYC2K_01675 [Gemmatimonadales bacterium]
MYADPSLIRKHRVTLYLNDAEAELVEATNKYLGGEKAPMLREMLIASAHRVLTGEASIAGAGQANEAPQIALFGN